MGDTVSTSPVQVPELVHALSDYLGTTEYHLYAGAFITSGRTVAGSPEHPYRLPDALAEQEMGVAFCTAEQGYLRIASLFHVSESMLAVARLAAVTLDGTERWNREILPANTGVLVFEEPLYIDDLWGHHLAYKAITWHRAQTANTGEWATAFTLYTDAHDPADTINRRMAMLGVQRSGPLDISHFSAFADEQRLGPEMVLSPAEIQAERDRRTAARAASGDPITEYSREVIARPPGIKLSINADRILFAIFALMSETITSVTEFEHRKTTKKFARRGILLPSKVVVIKLRRESQSGKRDPESGRFLLYQAMTRGHWRRQPYGPGRAQTKRIWIHPYMRGDPDGPVHQPVRVSTLSR